MVINRALRFYYRVVANIQESVGSPIEYTIYAFVVFVIAGLHGRERYALKNITIFFLVTWAVSFFFEALTIHTGLLVGHYHYMQSPISLLGCP